ncbi:hypothetical protein A33M_0604 [Rhodovulum sp. PH10]|uniref:DUF2269 family protein n=1 Tax=Rhodovulum sp. PH10 TaxID=1187851 RepID=UPI00027C25F5|nr:DUF2269 family protein [Rhodovulum sp. PH10]EJW13112.1 hypothetical protein A33M_0604 [Rhodovulum sp. PH10]
MLYDVFKVIHVVGVVVLVGNVTVTAFWKVFADRNGDPRVVAFGQRLVTITDWVFTVGGIVLIFVGGYGAAFAAGMNPFGSAWLNWGQGLFVASGLIWLGILIPAQIRLARVARTFEKGGEVPEDYWRIGRRWLFWGIVATFPLVGAIAVMILKP